MRLQPDWTSLRVGRYSAAERSCSGSGLILTWVEELELGDAALRRFCGSMDLDELVCNDEDDACDCDGFLDGTDAPGMGWNVDRDVCVRGMLIGEGERPGLGMMTTSGDDDRKVTCPAGARRGPPR